MRTWTFTVGLFALLAGHGYAADAPQIDWSKIPARTVTLFYPGQASYEWVRSNHKGDVKAARAAQRGEACYKCHEGDERALGERIVKGGPLEPTPVRGKVGAIDLSVQAAYDASNAYLRFQWKTQNPYPGTDHQYLRFDGKEWKAYGYAKLDKVVQEGKQPGIHEDRLAIMIDDGKVPEFSRQGCWLTCHDGQRDMAKQFTAAEVKTNALLAAIKKSDVRKYLPATRTDPTNWQTGKTLEELSKLRAAGGYVDLIQWRAYRSHGVAMADDGYVLEFRNSDGGRDMYSSNADRATHQPRFMWDEKKVGYRSVTESQLRKAERFLVREQNAVPFDPAAGWKEGDLLPDYVLSREDARGSAADNRASAQWKDGTWTVVVVRPLNLQNDDDKTLREGGVYNVGFAVHDDNITTRGHHVSFVRTLGIGARADIEAVRLR
jgi:hypothetical protein